MISVIQSIHELDHLSALHQAAAKALATMMDASTHYVVELNPHDAGEFRKNVTLLASQAAQVAEPDDYDVIRASFRGELREYRDKAHQELARLRADLKAAAEAMETFAAGISTGSDQHEKEIINEFDSLEKAAQTGDLIQIRAAIDHTVTTVRQSCHEMQSANKAVVAQLQDEIRSLHKEIEKERRALFTDRASGIWNRHKVDQRFQDLLRKDDPFCVLIVGIRNLRALGEEQSRTVVEGLLQALVKRLLNLAGDDAMLGRFNEDVFVAITDLEPGAAAELCKKLESKLTGNYSMQENGLSRTLAMDIKVGLVERPQSGDPRAFYPLLGKTATAVLQS